MPRTEVLNFVSEALRDLRFPEVSTDYARNFELDLLVDQGVARLLKEAVHFQLDTGGRILDDDLKGLTPELTKLPFPVISLSYRVTPSTPEEMPPGATATPHRITLAFEITERNVDLLTHLETTTTTPGLLQRYGYLLQAQRKQLTSAIGKGYIGVADIASYPRNLTGKERMWMTYPFLALINNKMDVWATTCTILLPVNAGRMSEQYGEDKVIDIAALDTSTSVIAVRELCEALSCRNVTHELLGIGGLNKKASKASRKHALPQTEMRILTIEAPIKSSSKVSQGGTHTSPREHLRRGHIRRLPTHNIWIQSTIVNAGVGGKIIKKYHVTKDNT